MKHSIVSICNQYEAGFGYGYDERKLPNPNRKGTDEFDAWQYGYDTGKLRLERKQKRDDREEGIQD